MIIIIIIIIECEILCEDKMKLKCYIVTSVLWSIYRDWNYFEVDTVLIAVSRPDPNYQKYILSQ